MGSSNAYQLLDVSPTATEQEIRGAYLKKAKLLHPDQAKEAQTTNDLFAHVQQAYETLKDPQRRAQLDKSLGVVRRFGSASIKSIMGSEAAIAAAGQIPLQYRRGRVLGFLDQLRALLSILGSRFAWRRWSAIKLCRDAELPIKEGEKIRLFKPDFSTVRDTLLRQIRATIRRNPAILRAHLIELSFPKTNRKNLMLAHLVYDQSKPQELPNSVTVPTNSSPIVFTTLEEGPFRDAVLSYGVEIPR
jgi:curved DNA-binding protein CbpA